MRPSSLQESGLPKSNRAGPRETDGNTAIDQPSGQSNTVSFTIKAQSLLRCNQIILLTKCRTLSKERGGIKQHIHRDTSESGAESIQWDQQEVRHQI